MCLVQSNIVAGLLILLSAFYAAAKAEPSSLSVPPLPSRSTLSYSSIQPPYQNERFQVPPSAFTTPTAFFDPVIVKKRQMILDIARTQLWVDKDMNRNYVNNAYSRGKDEAWCADFVSTILQWSIGSPWGFESLAHNIYLWGVQNNRLTLSPLPGDVVLFRYGIGDVSHVAIVETVGSDQSITTIGGNEGPRKGSTGGGGLVQRSRYRLMDEHIAGFLNPIQETTGQQNNLKNTSFNN